MAQLDRIEALLKTWEPKIKAAFLASVRAARGRVNLGELIRLLKAGDIESAVRVVGMADAAFRPLGRAMEEAFEAGGNDALLGVRLTGSPLGLRIAPVFDVRDPAANAWLTRHTTDLIRQITEEQRLVIRETLAPLRSGLDPMLTGQTPQKLALDLVGRVSRVTGQREGGVLGLTQEQARWASNYASEIRGEAPSAQALTRKLRDRRFDRTIERAMREGRSIPAATQEKMVAAYRNRALRYRAETIALNEASTALHQSQAEAWDQAVARGVVREDQVRRFWITAGDDRVRPTHRAVPEMNEKGVGLREPFQTPKGPTMQPGWEFDPGCRCRVRVRVVG